MDLVSARKAMVDSQVRTSDVTDIAIHKAMLETPREDFCAPDRAFAAYADALVPIVDGRFLMQAREVGKLMQALRPMPGERALALAAPYAAALMAHMGLEVVAQETDGMVAALVADGLGAAGAELVVADLATPSGSDWDVIISEGAVGTVPDAWLKALKPGGRLAVVERDGPVGHARLFVKAASGTVSSRDLFDATPPLLASFEKRPTFAL
ncbi:MAG TPA: protein-L-isoaspartate O-methyltransferase [Brevundimonas sp.]|uniref:protein-L-isoaspartate O-methyltransferase family protein n=1 Tax=Brevundimonas sp. TaxID=1871086 RepID=UPI002C2CF4BA|nr:protein-L-isoaspartate O-methyltransferase [Brevundimonas sp.]HRH20351.1 protein-L-isoaspartate O-methyltransferase [Brevundimonas sp.]